jgi:hypothetical protein
MAIKIKIVSLIGSEAANTSEELQIVKNLECDIQREDQKRNREINGKMHLELAWNR